MIGYQCLENTLCWGPMARAARLAAFGAEGGAGGPPEPPTLKELLAGTEVTASRGDLKRRPACLITDSRRVVPGALFFALGGLNTDGNLYTEEAIDRGAVGVVSENPPLGTRHVASVQVADARVALAGASRIFYGAPDEELDIFAVTGTNGKTTVTTLLRYLLEEASMPAGLIGTVNYIVGKRTLPAFKTTPEAVETYAMLRQMREAGCGAAVMEVSSHAIDQERVRGLSLRYGAFLNLTQDHIDYHGTMEAYYKVKRRLFTGETGAQLEAAAVNLDDYYGRRLIEEVGEHLRLLTFGISPDADVRAEGLDLRPEGARFTLVWPGGRAAVKSYLPGRYNVSNVLAALALVYLAGGDVAAAAGAVADFKAVPGRMERVDEGQPFEVLVDYAHTDDALNNLLSNLRPVTEGRLLVVFGCGGNRDRAKRPRMTGAVQKWADYAWATADNPRKEPLEQIFADMKEGVSDPARLRFVEDRRRAISLALEEAKPGDRVVVAGKGHETYQEFGVTVLPFDDRLVARELLRLKTLRVEESK